MNVQGAAVEQALGRAILPRFHAGWSIGTVTGAAVGAAMVAAGVPVTVHLLAVALCVAIAVPTTARGFLPGTRGPAHQDRPAHQDKPTVRRNPLAAWTERRTLLIGLFVFCMAFTEGSGNDWLSLAVIDGYHTTPVLGTLTFAIFLAAMTSAGARGITWIPGRPQRRCRRFPVRGRPGEHRRLDRLCGLPGRATGRRVPRRPHRRLARPFHRWRAARRRLHPLPRHRTPRWAPGFALVGGQGVSRRSSACCATAKIYGTRPRRSSAVWILFSDTGMGVPSVWAKRLTRSSSIIQRTVRASALRRPDACSPMACW